MPDPNPPASLGPGDSSQGSSDSAAGGREVVPEVDPVPTRRLGNVVGFDGIRGIAAVIVVTAHLEVILPIPTFAVVPGGTVPLDFFFTLSGFLITTLLLREQAKTGRIQKLHFYERRILRLVPALATVIVAHAIFAALTGISFHEEWTSLLSVGLYYSNWKLALNSNVFGGNIANGLQHMWSLSFEEQFYLIWPWLTIYFLTIRTRLRTVVIFIVVLILVIAVHRAILYHGTNWYPLSIRTDTRADSVLIGALAAHIWIRGREPRRCLPIAAWIASAFLLFCLPFTGTTGPFLFRGGYDLIDLCCVTLVLAVVDGNWIGRRLFELKPLVYVGTISYGVYLWHLPIFFAVRYYGTNWGDATKVVVALTATLAIASASWYVIERPALRLKERLAVVGARAVTPGGIPSKHGQTSELQPDPADSEKDDGLTT